MDARSEYFSMMGRETDTIPLTAEETKFLEREWKPIQGLLPGDQIRRKPGLGNNIKGHDENPVLTVYRVGEFPTVHKVGTPVRIDDFTWIEKREDETGTQYIEFAGESRNYEIVF
jgi:hypothetical protein